MSGRYTTSYKRSSSGGDGGGGKKNSAPRPRPTDKIENRRAEILAAALALLALLNIGTPPSTGYIRMYNWVNGLLDAPAGVRNTRFSVGAVLVTNFFQLVRDLSTSDFEALIEDLAKYYATDDD